MQGHPESYIRLLVDLSDLLLNMSKNRNSLHFHELEGQEYVFVLGNEKGPFSESICL